MELLATDGPLKYGQRVREARDVDRLLVSTSETGARLTVRGQGA